MFCVFEGLDGSGKTTLLHAIAGKIGKGDVGWFTSQFEGLELLKEPTDLESGRRIREMLRDGKTPGRGEWLEYFLEDRANNVGLHILPGLKEGKLVLQDRYYWSTAAYQGRMDEAPTPTDIVRMNEERGFPKPGRLFYLELSPEQAVERARSRGALETFETLEQLTKIHEHYEVILPDSAIRLDGRRPTSELVDIVLEKIIDS